MLSPCHQNGMTDLHRRQSLPTIRSSLSDGNKVSTVSD